MTERRLMAASAGGDQVVTIFSVQNSGAVQGAAIFTGDQQVQGGRSGVMMDWLMTRDRQPVMLSCLQVRLEASRDGQEVDPVTGQTILNNLGIVLGQTNQIFGGMPSGRRLDREFYR